MDKETARFLKQASHDIRSPISALNLVIGSLTNIPENKRALATEAIGRIQAIADRLLEQSANAQDSK
jgi:hypothetical protein